MKNAISNFLLVLMVSWGTFPTGCQEPVLDPIQEAREFQKELNAQFADSEETPLTEEDWLTFDELEFFPIDTSFRVRARLELHEDSTPFAMPTTTDRLPVYKLYATASFRLQGEDCKLEIYQNQDLVLDPEFSDYLFLPFTDKTNGNGSYGGGRYIDLVAPDGDEIIIDFNQSYNPYCAYNSEYSCPIPPRVNDLNLRFGPVLKPMKIIKWAAKPIWPNRDRQRRLQFPTRRSMPGKE